VYLFYSGGEDETAVAAWLAPLGLVRTSLPACPLRRGPGSCFSAAQASWESQRFDNPNPSCPAVQAGLVLVPQLQDPDLGARLHHAMAHAFAAGHQRVAVVGTDVPDLNASLVARALAALDNHQARAL
jgi:hypothetical protein